MSPDDTTGETPAEGKDRTSQSSRRCSLAEVVIYLTLWAGLFAAWRSEFIRSINDVEVFLYLAPGPLAGGGIGFILGGRKSIVDGMVLGFIGWMIAGFFIFDSVSL